MLAINSSIFLFALLFSSKIKSLTSKYFGNIANSIEKARFSARPRELYHLYDRTVDHLCAIACCQSHSKRLLNNKCIHCRLHQGSSALLKKRGVRVIHTEVEILSCISKELKFDSLQNTTLLPLIISLLQLNPDPCGTPLPCPTQREDRSHTALFQLPDTREVIPARLQQRQPSLL